MITTITLAKPFDSLLETNLRSHGFTFNFRTDNTYLEITHDKNDTDLVITICRPYFTNIEKQWENIKIIRNKALIESDWTQVLDAPLSPEKKLEWQIYRQNLRDLPQLFENPEDVTFPEQPSNEN